jgi:hypothetical protein
VKVRWWGHRREEGRGQGKVIDKEERNIPDFPLLLQLDVIACVIIASMSMHTIIVGTQPVLQSGAILGLYVLGIG